MRLFSKRALVVIALLCGIETRAEAEEVVGISDEEKVICGAAATPVGNVVTDHRIVTPRVLLRGDGTVELAEPRANPATSLSGAERDGLSFRYADDSDNPRKAVLLRVDRISPRGVRRLMCRTIEVGKTYLYSFDSAVLRQGDILSWVVFGPAEGPGDKDANAFFPARVARLKALETEITKQAPQRLLHLIDPAYVEAAKKYVGNRGPEPAWSANDALKQMRERWGCNTAPLDKRYAPIEQHFAWRAVCAKLVAFERALNSVSTQSPAANVSSYAAVLDVLGERPDPDEFCEKVAKYRWVKDSESLVRLAAFELPFSRNVDEIHQVVFDSGASTPLDLDPEAEPLLLLTDVPSDQGSIKLRPQFEGVTVRDGGVVVAQFALNIASFAAGNRSLDFKFVGFLRDPNAAVPASEKDEFDCAPELKFDPDLQTRARVGTRARRVSEKLGERKLTLKICSGITCEEAKDDKPGTVTNTVLFVPKRGNAPFVMAGLGASMIEGRYKLDQVSSGSGPDDIYELTRDAVDLAPSVDLLLGLPVVRPYVAVFLGPALVAKNYDLLRLWKGGLALRHPRFSKFIYLLVHVSVGLRDEVSDPKLNQRWVVASGAKAPNLPTEQRLVWGAGLSLGIDLELFGSAAGNVLNKITGADE